MAKAVKTVKIPLELDTLYLRKIDKLVDRKDQISVNVGVLGHVDCGKTSLCKALSLMGSTAAFDSNPQSQARGITIDLGFSAFPLANKYNVTLVDCPGHASLIRTVLGGVRIMDLMILVVDVTKGMQPQSWECLILANITTNNLVIALNKSDLIPARIRTQDLEKIKRLMRKTLSKTKFGSAPMVVTSATDKEIGTIYLKDEIMKIISTLELKRDISSPFFMAVDHCFNIKGAGAVCTGTVLQGQIKINDNVEFPEIQTIKKVKSMQSHHVPVDYARAGDRVGLGIPGLDAKTVERAIICAPGLIPLASRAAVIKVEKIPFFKEPIESGRRYHCSIGYSTVTAVVQFFTPDPLSLAHDDSDNIFKRSKEYLVEDALEVITVNDEPRGSYFAVLDFDRPVFILPNTMIIASNLQEDDETVPCRLAFHGHVVETTQDKDYRKTYFPTFNLFFYKRKCGIVDRIPDHDTLIVRGFCHKHSNVDHLIGLKVTAQIESVETKKIAKSIYGRIQGRFGQTNKVRIILDKVLNDDEVYYLKCTTCVVDLKYKEYKYKIKAGTGRRLCQ